MPAEWYKGDIVVVEAVMILLRNGVSPLQENIVLQSLNKCKIVCRGGREALNGGCGGGAVSSSLVGKRLKEGSLYQHGQRAFAQELQKFSPFQGIIHGKLLGD